MFTKILYPTDFSDVAGKTLAYVKKLREAGTKEVVVLHVLDEKEIESFSYGVAWAGNLPIDLEKDVLKKLQEEAQEKLKDIESELKERGFKVKVRIERGSPFKEILSVANEDNVSLIAIGSHGKSNIKEMFLGSVSENVIRHCQKPVLVVKR